MKQNIIHIALVVKNYDEAIDFYVNKLKFELIDIIGNQTEFYFTVDLHT